MTVIQKYNSVLLVVVVLMTVANMVLTGSKKQPISTISATQIESIEIHTDLKQMAFKKSGNLWTLVDDEKTSIDPGKINKLLELLDTHSFRQFENTPDNREAFELEDSKNYYLFNNSNITFGTLDPVDQHRYILINDQIHLITDYYYQFLLADKAFFTETSE